MSAASCSLEVPAADTSGRTAAYKRETVLGNAVPAWTRLDQAARAPGPRRAAGPLRCQESEENSSVPVCARLIAEVTAPPCRVGSYRRPSGPAARPARARGAAAGSDTLVTAASFVPYLRRRSDRSDRTPWTQAPLPRGSGIELSDSPAEHLASAKRSEPHRRSRRTLSDACSRTLADPGGTGRLPLVELRNYVSLARGHLKPPCDLCPHRRKLLAAACFRRAARLWSER